MPPLRGSSGVRGRSRDIVSQVEDKLKLNNSLPREILEATRSSLRVLKIRNPIGCFGKYDNDTKRACALLEYDIRDYNNNINNNNNNTDSNNVVKVAMERLAKAAFMKSKDFRDFHEKIGNFRQNLRINATTTSKTKVKIRNDSSENRRAVAATSKNGIVFRNSSISSLAIQLGAFVPNSSDVAVRAHRLFTKVVGLLEKSSKKGGMYGLRDVQNNQRSYEAACFYLIATSEQGKQDSNASIRRRRRFQKEYDDGDDIQQLDLITFTDMANVSSQFQMILDYVSQLRNEIESKQSTNHSTSEESRRSRPSFNSSKFSHTTKSTTSKKRSKAEVFDIAQVVGNDIQMNNDERSDDRKPGHEGDLLDTNKFFRDDRDRKENNNYDHKLRKRRRRSNTTFKEWKSKVLCAACEDAKQKMSKGNARNGVDCEKKQKMFEPEGILDFVIGEILARNGLCG